jgi:hypothetical protein
MQVLVLRSCAGTNLGAPEGSQTLCARVYDNIEFMVLPAVLGTGFRFRRWRV